MGNTIYGVIGAGGTLSFLVAALIAINTGTSSDQVNHWVVYCIGATLVCALDLIYMRLTDIYEKMCEKD